MTAKKPTTVNYSPMVSIGASKESVTEVRAAINDILKSGAEQETLRFALDVLRTACKVEGVTVSSCSFEQGTQS